MLQNPIHGGVAFCGKPAPASHSIDTGTACNFSSNGILRSWSCSTKPWTDLSPTAACSWRRPRSTLFAPRTLTKMDQADRVRAVYLHACLRYVEREFMTNTSLRERFGIDTKNSATASRLIKEAVSAGVVRLSDPDAPPKMRRYVPRWA